MKELRKQKRISKRALGRKVGVNAKTVKCWEQGKSMPGIRMLMKLSKALAVDYITLMDRMSAVQSAL